MTLDFDIEGRIRKRRIQGFECGNLDALGSPRKGQTAVRAEPVAGVKILQFWDSLLGEGSCAIGCPINDCVMNDHEGAFSGCVYIAFHDPASQGKSFAEPFDRVLRYHLCPTAMSEVDRPAARSRWLRRRITLRREPRDGQRIAACPPTHPE